jgi:hypothetical protein
MREHLLGRRPRFTAYVAGLAVGLSLLAVGVEAARVRLVGPLSPAVFAGYAGIGLLGGLLLAYVVAYLNGSLVAAWTTGTIPAAGRLGARVIEGSVPDVFAGAVGTAGVGFLVGGLGFLAATEKHRRDARTAELPPPPSQASSLGLVVASLVVGAGCLAVAMLI